MNPMTTKEMLESVSRSFALCIPMLEDNKRKAVENTYLLSRAMDTIEDSRLDVGEKKALMALFFRTLDDDMHVEEFAARLSAGIIDEHDKVLGVAENYRLILDDFRTLDNDVRKIAVDLLEEMSSGMTKYLEKRIETFDDLDEYCYYVAGIVGRFMNKLVEIKDGIILDEDKAVAMGRYLQKVNIIKNFLKDKTEGRSFWPAMNESNEAMLERMIKSALAEMDDTFSYAASVPLALGGYRSAVLLPMLMATENLAIMRNNPDVFTKMEGVKIPRHRMPEIMETVADAAHSNSVLEECRKILQ